jgi:RNA polymerase sigma-70 factor (ECF subfamily)
VSAGANDATSSSLLLRLRRLPLDQAAWSEFVDRYGPRIYAWCQRWHLQEADAHDVTQDVLVRLAQKMSTFAYNRALSFRGWLRTVTMHALDDFITSRRRAERGAGGDQGQEILNSFQAREDFQSRVQTAFDLEILEMAQDRVRLRVGVNQWDAYRLTIVEGLPTEEAAARLKLPGSTVLVYKCKVRKQVRSEIQKLERSSEDGTLP